VNHIALRTRNLFFCTLFLGHGGAAAVAVMSPEAKADAIEEHMMRQLDQAVAKKKAPMEKQLRSFRLPPRWKLRSRPDPIAGASAICSSPQVGMSKGFRRCRLSRPNARPGNVHENVSPISIEGLLEDSTQGTFGENFTLTMAIMIFG
jgi:hypothetical protein